MSRISLALAKETLRITHSLQDVAIERTLEGLEELAEHYCNTKFGPVLPISVQNACLFMLPSAWDFEEVGRLAISPGSATASLLGPYKSWAKGYGDPPTVYEIDPESITQGDNWNREWQWFDDLNSPNVVTGFSGVFKISDIEVAVNIVDALLGKVAVNLLPAQTNLLPVGKNFYSLVLTSGTGVVSTIDSRFIVIR